MCVCFYINLSGKDKERRVISGIIKDTFDGIHYILLHFFGTWTHLAVGLTFVPLLKDHFWGFSGYHICGTGAEVNKSWLVGKLKVRQVSYPLCDLSGPFLKSQVLLQP